MPAGGSSILYLLLGAGFILTLAILWLNSSPEVVDDDDDDEPTKPTKPVEPIKVIEMIERAPDN
ncbi:MAG: hypothetical protein LBL95_09440, partial [Deltaproteobacteria bacterium]|nr:hypothetical protein [Deltaproteobacteria bacterium]